MIVGFNFTSMNVERKQKVSGNLQISHNINIKQVRPEPIALKNRTSAVFDFVFTVTYAPSIADITLTGEAFYLHDDKKVKEVLQLWEKSKKVAQDVSLEVLNYIMRKCNIKALELSQSLNLPPHIPMPQITKKTKASDYIG